MRTIKPTQMLPENPSTSGDGDEQQASALLVNPNRAKVALPPKLLRVLHPTADHACNHSAALREAVECSPKVALQ